MIIEGKANRQQSEQINLRDRLESKPEKTSRVPVYVALLITSVAAFIKSAFPAQSEDAANPHHLGSPAANSSGQRGDRMASGDPGIDDTTTGGIDDARIDDSIGGTVSGWDAAFSMTEPVSFAYTGKSFEFLGANAAPFFPAALSYRPQNDNVVPPSQHSSDVPLSPAGKPGAFTPSAQPGDPAGGGTTPPVAGELSPSDDDDADNDNDSDEEDQDDDEDEDHLTPLTNRAPTVLGPVRLRDVFAGQIILIGLSDLLFGASDPDGDILTINDLVATGGALVQAGAGWSFASLAGMLGTITFSYNVSDGLLSVIQTATLHVVRNTILLTPCDDVFVGTPYDDDIDALAGDDIIDARAGNDAVVGGLGDDHINGGDGDDQLFGGLGYDVIFGGRGNDTIGGGQGDDRLFGEEGDDVIDGDEGDDDISGGLGDDIVRGGEGNDRIDGNEGADVLIAGAGDDIVSGDDGADIIEGNEGDDDLSGGTGNDTVDGGNGDDVVYGNEGADVLIGGAGDDTVWGDTGDDTITGDAGDDTLAGGAGDDAIDGGIGDDVIEGGEGQDTLAGAAGDDMMSGGEGNDQLEGEAGDDTLAGGVGDDLMDGGEGDDTLLGGDGDDVLLGGAGDDEIDAGAGSDVITGDSGNDVIDGGEGHDMLDYSQFTADIHLDFEAGIAWSAEIDEDLFANVEEVIGGQGNDTFIFGDSTAIISGGAGDDLFIFTIGEDTPALSRQLVFEILDFVVGDRVHVADYELSHREARLEEERFGDIYDELEDGFEANLPIRVTHAYYDDMDHTIIEADVDRNDFYEISITLDGVQLPLTIGHHVA